MTYSRSDAGKLGYQKSRSILLALCQQRKQEATAKYDENPKLCGYCKCKISYKNRCNQYCNHSCAAKINNRNKPSKARGSCIRCGNQITRAKKYCSSCWTNKHALENLNTDQSRKRLIIKERGIKCELCGITEWRGQATPVQLDHIDGNSDHNTRDNLRLLCPNCHALTPTFTSRNRKNYNSSRNLKRRKRYHRENCPGSTTEVQLPRKQSALSSNLSQGSTPV